jgi:hypothetical protein
LIVVFLAFNVNAKLKNLIRRRTQKHFQFGYFLLIR